MSDRKYYILSLARMLFLYPLWYVGAAFFMSLLVFLPDFVLPFREGLPVFGLLSAVGIFVHYAITYRTIISLAKTAIWPPGINVAE